MLEPFLMLTVLNCFFMFSSTVTTCALWWQYRRHRHSCSSHGGGASGLKVKKSRSCETGKKCYTSDIVGVPGAESSVKKRGKSGSRVAKESRKDKKTKSPGPSMKPGSKERREEAVRFLEKLTSTEDTRQRAASPSSKSTVVMEVSTVQKVVQIFDNDPRIAGSPKEVVTYRFLPENERKIEFVVQSKPEERSRAVDKN